MEEDAQIIFTPKGLRQFFERTWDLAHKQGIENGRALEAMDEEDGNENPPKYDSSDFRNMFGSMFGKI